MNQKRKVKKERMEKTTSQNNHGNQDLTCYINDRVKLLQEVFSVLKAKEIQAIVPDCVRHLSTDNLEELCLEELLGISSKRLCSIMNGTDPPSDTGSSSDSSDRILRAASPVSLDSISSDEAALSIKTESDAHDKKKKHCKRKSKKKHKEKSKSKSKTKAAKGEDDKSHAAERAGLTVLELLELQARARAIRAQLQAEQEQKRNMDDCSEAFASASDDDDVLIKEEPAEIVELVSSDDEKKPDVQQLNVIVNNNSKDSAPSTADNNTMASQSEILQVIHKRNDLTIIVPKTATPKKIKLKRNKIASLPSQLSESNETTNSSDVQGVSSAVPECTKNYLKNTNIKENHSSPCSDKGDCGIPKRKKRKSKSLKIKAVSDDDEIKLELSDSEKMDLFEEGCLHKNYSDEASSSGDDTDDSKAIINNKIKSEMSKDNDNVSDNKSPNVQTSTESNTKESKDTVIDKDMDVETIVRNTVENKDYSSQLSSGIDVQTNVGSASNTADSEDSNEVLCSLNGKEERTEKVTDTTGDS